MTDRQRSKILRRAILTLSVFTIAAMAADRQASAQGAMPNVVGLSVKQAKAKLQPLNVQLLVLGYARDWNRISEQQIAAGTQLRRGQTVTVRGIKAGYDDLKIDSVVLPRAYLNFAEGELWLETRVPQHGRPDLWDSYMIPLAKKNRPGTTHVPLDKYVPMVNGVSHIFVVAQDVKQRKNPRTIGTAKYQRAAKPQYIFVTCKVAGATDRLRINFGN